jgi:hypothetical protein
MKTKNSNLNGATLRAALLALSLSGAAVLAGCNKPAEEPPVPTDTAPPPAETSPPANTPPPAPTDQNPDVPPADDPATTPAPTDSDAPPSGG